MVSLTASDGITLKTLPHSGNENETTTTAQGNLSQYVHTVAQNTSLPNGCQQVVFNEMEFLPWDNADNIVSAETENIVRQIKNNVMVFLFLIGGPANVINMAVFYKQGLRDRVNLSLFALSLADELHLFNSVIHHGEQVYIQFTSKVRFGPLSTLLSNNNFVFLLEIHYVSFVLSAIIAIERCLCIYNPLKFHRMLSTRAMAVIIIVVYVSVIGLFFPAAFRYRVGCIHDPVTGVTVITAVEGEFYRAHKEFIDPLEGYTFGVGLPGIVIVVVIAATVMTIVKLREIVRWRSKSSSSISAREVALTKTLVVNSIFFTACLFPTTVNRFSWLFLPEINTGRRHHNFFLMGLWVSEICTYINATFNIFVYYFMGSRYRETFWALCGKQIHVREK